MKKRILSILLCVCMMLTLLPISAQAGDGTAGEATVKIAGVEVADNDWYATTDETGTVTVCSGTDEWNIHVSIVDADEETGGVESTTSAAITLRNATITNEGEAPTTHAISASNCDLNITLQGTTNQIGTVASNDVYGYAVYAETGNNVTITGDGDLTLKGNYGINVDGSGTVSINTTGSLDITSWYQMIWCNNLDISADSIDADGYYFMAGEASLSATEGDISITGSGNYGIQAYYGDVTVAAPNGAIFLSGENYAIMAASYTVNVSAKNDIALTGTVNAKEISAASEMGSVTIDGHYEAIESAQTAVTLEAPAGDIILNADNSDNIISGTNNYTLAITAGGTLDAEGPYGIVSYGNAVIKAENVYVALNDKGSGFSGGALTITDSEGGNCSKVSISGGAGNYDAINAYGDINIKADQVEIMAAPDAQHAIKANNISNPVAVTIGDSGVIVGAISISGADNIADGVACAVVYGDDASYGYDASNGLNLSEPGVPKVSTYYSAKISGDSGYIVWEPEVIEESGSEYIVSGTITLHDAEIAGITYDSGILLPSGYSDIPVDNIRLILEGDSNINYGSGISYRDGYTSYLESFTVSEGINGGTLTIGSTYPGIYLTCPITVESGTLDVTSYENHAIVTTGADSDITINGGTVHAIANTSASDDDDPYFGIYSKDGDVIINGGTVDTSGTGGSIGVGTDCRVSLYSNSDVNVTGPIIVEGTSIPARLSDIFSKAETVTGTVNNATIEVHDYTGSTDRLLASYGVSGMMDITTSGLSWYNEGSDSNIPLERTTYKAGEGTVVFTPAEGGNPAMLTLSDATAGTLDISAVGDIILELTGNNTIDSETGGSIIADNINLTGSGSLTATGEVDENFGLKLAGIIARNGFMNNASGVLNSIVAVGRGSLNNQYDLSVYGSATIDGNFSIANGDTFIVTPGAVLTILEDGCLYINTTASISNNGLIVNNGEIVLPGGYTVEQVEALDITGSGIVILYDAEADIERVIVNGSIYAYVDARHYGDLDFSEVPDEATYYSIYSGYIILTPAIGENPAVLALYDVGGAYEEYPEYLLGMTLPDIPLELQLHGENQLGEIQNSESITVSGSGVLDAENISGSNPLAMITVNSGATLNAKYQTYQEDVQTETNTIYGSYQLSDMDSLQAVNGEEQYRVVLAPGAVLTLEDESFLWVEDFTCLTIGEGASIVNNTVVILPRGTTADEIAALPLTGNGVVRVITSESGVSPETYDIYTNDGTALSVIDDLDLTGANDEIPESEGRGYSWTRSGEGDSEVWTLTLYNAYISGSLTLPDETIVISNTVDTFIRGDITLGYEYPCDLTITGSGTFIAGGISGSQGGEITVTGGAEVIINGSVNFGDGGGLGAALNVTGTGTTMSVSSLHLSTAVYCDTVNVDDGASLTVSAYSRGINALTGVNVTGGSTLTTNCEYGVYIIDGMLEVDDDSTLVTNASVAPFCVVDRTNLKSQGQAVSLPGLPAGTAIASVTGTDAGLGYNYWSLVPTGGSLGVANENNEPAALSGAVIGPLNFAKAPDPDDDDPDDDDPGSGSGGSVSYTVTFETSGGSVISPVSKRSGSVIDLSTYLPTRDGFDFEGWYSDTALTKKITSVEITKNTTVYSKWTKKSEQITNPFTDVSDSAYYYNAVIWAVGKGITNGTTSTTFSPEAITTRAQTVAFLWRTMGSPEPASQDCPFRDVAKDVYYYKALLWATEKGITVGTSSTTFSPDDTVTRCQTVTFLWRMAGKPPAADTNPFADVTGNAYYYGAALWAAEKGITQGVSPTAFGPSDPCERAQIVTFLYRYIGLSDSE